MTTTPHDSVDGGHATVDEEAIDWVVRLTVGTPSADDLAGFVRWREASPAHEQAFDAASDLCGALRRAPLEGVPGLVPAADNVLPFVRPVKPTATPPGRINRRGFLGGGAVAASLAGGLLALDPPLDLWPSLAELMADERAAAGQRRAFSPVAGVTVELNSRSSAINRAGGQALALIAGEAFVTVSAKARPFTVAASDTRVTARDAVFDVQAYDERLCVTCIRGSLSVMRGDVRTMLAGGRQIEVGDDGAMAQRTSDTLVQFAWRRGLLILRATPLDEAIRQINRYFPGRLVLTDAAKSDWPVTGVFHIDQIDLAVVQLQRLLDVAARHLPGGVVLLG